MGLSINIWDTRSTRHIASLCCARYVNKGRIENVYVVHVTEETKSEHSTVRQNDAPRRCLHLLYVKNITELCKRTVYFATRWYFVDICVGHTIGELARTMNSQRNHSVACAIRKLI